MDTPDVHAKACFASAVSALISVVICMSTESDYRTGHEGNEHVILAFHWLMVFSLVWMALLCHKKQEGSISFFIMCLCIMFMFGVLIGESSHEHPADVVFILFSWILFIAAVVHDMLVYLREQTICHIDPAMDTEN